MWPSADMGLGKRRVDLERLDGRGACLGQRLHPVGAEQQMGVRQSGVGKRVLRVLANRLLEVLDGSLVALERAFVPVIPALEIDLVRLRVLGVLPGDPLALRAAQPRLDLVEDFFRDAFLHGEQIRLGPIVLIAPDLRAAVDVHQLRPDHNAVAAHRDASRDDGPDIEIASDLPGLGILAFVLEHDAAGADAQVGQLRQPVDQASR